MTFRPGTPKPPGSGRTKGTPNQSTRAVREALIEAFDRLGGVDYLVGLGQSDPSTFARLLVRLIPNEVAVRGQDVTVYYRIHRGPKPSDGEVPR